MSKYQNGKIYKIVDVGYNKCYIGSTCEELSQRMARHRNRYTAYKSGKKGKTTCFNIFEEYGVENCKIELVEYCSCDTKEELRRKEGEYIKNTDCVNKIIAGRTVKQYREDNKDIISKNAKIYKEEHKERLIQYRKDNAEYFNQKKREQYIANKESINERHRQHYLENKESISSKHKEHYQQNKERVLANQAQKIECPCGSIHRKGDKAKHEKSQKHQNYLKGLEEEKIISCLL